MSKITLTFEVQDSDEAALLMVAFDAITQKDPSGSIILIEHFGWLINTLQEHAGDIFDAQLDHTGKIDPTTQQFIVPEFVKFETQRRIDQKLSKIAKGDY